MGNKEENVVHGAEPIVPLFDKHSLGQLLLDKLRLHGTQTSMIDASTKEKLTFNQLLEKTIRAAESLKSLGISKNDVISVSSENQLNFIVPVIAALYLGVSIAPLNHNYTKSELLHTISISKPKAIFCSSTVANKYLELRKQLPFIQYIITLESDAKLEGFDNIEEFFNRSVPVKDLNNYKILTVDPKEQVAFIMCSSGTTGMPKGVMLTHLNIITSLANHQDPRFAIFKQSKENTNLGALPFFHALGFITLFTSVIHGSLVVVLRRFEERTFLSAIQDYRIISLMLVPPIMVLLAKSPAVDDYDISSLRHITCGAAPLSKEVEEDVKKRLKLNEIRQGYGLTECTLAVIMNPPNCVKSGSSGIVVPHMKCKVVDIVTGKALGVRQPGELCFKGPMVMKGYYGNPTATKEIYDDDGWLHTGDIGYYDEDRYFYIIDRIKELIKYKAFQVPPAELEYLLLTNPLIKDAAVIGIPHDTAGELPLAFVVKVPGKTITAAQVQQFIAKLVSPQKRLHGGVVFIDEIPKNPSGKILRRELREMIKKRHYKL